MNFVCKLCSNTWYVELKLPMSVLEYARRLKEVYCGQCNAPETAMFITGSQALGIAVRTMPEVV